jgi:hypothetical protein
MVIIKDPALGKYSISEDAQGVNVLDENGKSLVKVTSLEQALQYIAQHLVIDEDATCTLYEYGMKKRAVFESIVAAQEGKQSNENLVVVDTQHEIPFEEAN